MRLIRAHRGRNCDVVVWGRDGNGKYSYVFSNFRPYFFIPKGETVNSKLVTGTEDGGESLEGEPLTKVYVSNPSDVPVLRDECKRTWEADIPYARRFLIDKMVTSGFEVEDRNIIPQDFNPNEEFGDLQIAYFDVECLSSGSTMPDPAKDPITCLCVALEGRYVSAILDDVDFTGESDGWVIAHRDSEEKVLRYICDLLKTVNCDVLSGWNVEFDVEYLAARCKAHGITLPMSGTCAFDLLKFYRKLYRRKSYRLKDVAQDEGLGHGEPQVDYGKMWEDDKPGLLARNKRHVEWVYGIDLKRKITDYAWTLKEFAGLEDTKDIAFNSVVIDTALLRRTAWALPSKAPHEHTPFEGAYVKEPPKGVVKGVAVYDFTTLYPSILLKHNLDPKILCDFKRLHPDETVDWASYDKFAKGRPSLLIGFLREMVALRTALKNSPEHAEKYMSVKGVLNSVYGCIGSHTYRLYMPEIPARVTEVARDMIQALAELLDNHGYYVKYCDTDSCWCEVPEEHASALAGTINVWLDSKYGKDAFSVKLEHYCDRVLFGGKKRYALVENGEVHTTGFETVKSDASLLTKEMQERLFRIALELDSEDPVTYVRWLVNTVRERPLTEISVVKGISRGMDEYKTKQDYIKAVEKATWLNVNPGDSVRIVPATNYPFGVCVYQDEGSLPWKVEVDWEKVVKSQIEAKCNDILEMVGRSWAEVKGQSRLL